MKREWTFVLKINEGKSEFWAEGLTLEELKTVIEDALIETGICNIQLDLTKYVEYHDDPGYNFRISQ